MYTKYLGYVPVVGGMAPPTSRRAFARVARREKVYLREAAPLLVAAECHMILVQRDETVNPHARLSIRLPGGRPPASVKELEVLTVRAAVPRLAISLPTG